MARALTQYRAARLDDAAIGLDALIAARPDDAEALDLSGLVALGRGQVPVSMFLKGRTLAFHGPDVP